MSLWGRMLSPLKSARSDIEFAITALSATTCVEIIVQKPENYRGYNLNDCMLRGKLGVDHIVGKKHETKFISDKIKLDFAHKEISEIINKRISSDFDSINLFWKGLRHFYDLNLLIIIMNDYAGHNLIRARDGVAQLSLGATGKFIETFRTMVRRALKDHNIDPILIDPLGFGLVNWETLESLRR